MGNRGSNKNEIPAKISNIVASLESKYKNMTDVAQNSFEQFKSNHVKQMGEQFEHFKVQLENKYNGLFSSYKKSSDETIETLKNENTELKKQLESLKSIADNSTKLTSKPKKEVIQENNNIDSKIKELSKERINEFVEKILADTDMNIAYIPDFVERQIYRNVFCLLLDLLEKTIDTTSLNFIGHTLTLKLQPTEQKQVENPVEHTVEHTEHIIEQVEKTIEPTENTQ